MAKLAEGPRLLIHQDNHFMQSTCMQTHAHTHHADDCYSSSDHGQSYTGHLATTQRGECCQSWSEPHLLFHPGLYTELEGAANLCRNPGQLKDRIWCFTSESAWDYCPVPTNCSKCMSTCAQYLHHNNIYCVAHKHCRIFMSHAPFISLSLSLSPSNTHIQASLKPLPNPKT